MSKNTSFYIDIAFTFATFKSISKLSVNSTFKIACFKLLRNPPDPNASGVGLTLAQKTIFSRKYLTDVGKETVAHASDFLLWNFQAAG